METTESVRHRLPLTLFFFFLISLQREVALVLYSSCTSLTDVSLETKAQEAFYIIGLPGK